jgi:hypothetical protein
MAPPHPKRFNRRQLLGSAAGVVAAGIVPGVEKARGADPATVTLAKSKVGEAPVLNV